MDVVFGTSSRRKGKPTVIYRTFKYDRKHENLTRLITKLLCTHVNTTQTVSQLYIKQFRRVIKCPAVNCRSG